LQLDGKAIRLLVLATALATAGCRQDMHDQPKFEPLEASSFFTDGKASRDLVEGTVARGMLRDNKAFYSGLTEDDQFAQVLPMKLDRELLERGRNRFEAYCSACHGRAGYGQGMVVQRGFKHPQSFHEERLRQSPVGYFYSVMTNGFGNMSGYAVQLTPEDRWAVAAYIRALQLSQNAPVSELSEVDLERIDETAGAATDGAEHSEGAQPE
jgi:mono/diheme cytochrome c family protein